MNTTPSDTLVNSYLHAVDQALGGDVSVGRRAELLDDLREHIEVERSALDPESETGIRSILDRLGDPDVVAAAARLEHGTPPRHQFPPAQMPAPAPPLAPAPALAQAPAPAVRSGNAVRWVVAVALTVAVLCAGMAFLAFATSARMDHGPTNPVPRPAPSIMPSAVASASN